MSNYDFKVVAIPNFDSSGNTNISDVGFTIMLPAGNVDVSGEIGLLESRTWTVNQFNATALMSLGGDGTEDGFLFNLSPGQVLLAHANEEQIDLVSFSITNMPTNGIIRILLNSETIAINAAGALDSFYNSNIDATSTDDYFGGIAGGLGSFTFSLLGTEDDRGLGSIQIYPNPTKGLFYIDGDVTKLKGINIYSMTGQHVMELKDRFRAINISSLQAGIYFVKMHTSDATATFKIIRE